MLQEGAVQCGLWDARERAGSACHRRPQVPPPSSCCTRGSPRLAGGSRRLPLTQRPEQREPGCPARGPTCLSVVPELRGAFVVLALLAVRSLAGLAVADLPAAGGLS